MSNTTPHRNEGRKVSAFLLRFVMPFVFIVLMWQIVAMVVDRDFLVPYPVTVLVRLGELVVVSEFWLSIFSTLGRVAFGFLLGVLSGVLIASFMHAFKIIDYLLSPLMKIMKTTPVVSFILILLLWLDSSFLPTIVSAIMVTPVVWANVFSGLKDIKPEYLEMATVYHVPFLTRITQIYVPALKAHFFAATLSAVGLAWKSGVTAEVLALPGLAIGQNLYNAKIYLESPDIFAWTIVIILLSFLFENLVMLLGKKALRGEIDD